MAASYCISLDAMGGDFGPRVTVNAAVDALKRHSSLSILLVGHRDEITPYLQKLPSALISRLEIVHAETSISMDEKPSVALRHHQNSSMGKALSLVADGRASACVSAGNTGALMALGCAILGTIEGLDRPAITTAIPTITGESYLMDLGANIDCSPEKLLQFAVMGAEMLSVLRGDPHPSIGLLNIGAEQNKGTEQVRATARLIEHYGQLNYIGFVEGNDLFAGKADLVVCDGFIGNIALKSSEGVSRMIARKVQQSFTRNLYRRFLAMLAAPVLNELRTQLDPGLKNGATLLGLQGVVIKSHGSAGRQYLGCAIDQAVAEVGLNIPHRIGKRVSMQLAACEKA